MKTKPILFSGAMVRALLDGRKTQTRRIIKPQPNESYTADFIKNERRSYGWCWQQSPSHMIIDCPSEQMCKRCPYGKIGDLLWVRESFSYEALDVEHVGFMPPWYWADGSPLSGDYTKPKPSIHMPRWASRLTLEITDIRVERLQDISEADARAEGIIDGGCNNCGNSEPCGCPTPQPLPIDGFVYTWHKIYGEMSWYNNPWVWVIEFRVHKQNVDDVLKTKSADGRKYLLSK